MGQFSWFSQDTNEQIFNDAPAGTQTVHMVDPRDGTDYVETDYDGYGRFGGLDFYCLIVDINKKFLLEYTFAYKPQEDIDKFEKLLEKDNKDLTENEIIDKRGIGIDLWFTYFEPKRGGLLGRGNQEDADRFRKEHNLLSPILVMDYDSWRLYANPESYPESDPDQGWGYGMEDESEEE